MKVRRGLFGVGRMGGAVRMGGALTVAALLAMSGIALASNAVKGAAYSGHYTGRPTDLISFTVSASGKDVTDLYANTPFKCSGGCGGVESVTGVTARISKAGTFKATFKLTLPGQKASYGSVTITGTFLKSGRAKGKITSHFKAGSDGETVSWTAAAALG